MNILLAIAVMIVIIIASYLADRKYPTKRIFIIPCGIILLCFVAVYSSLVIPSSSNSISTEQRLAILNEQPYFITWYNDYKEDINQLDRFATVYHKIISNYENQSISATEALSQLQRLYDETNAFNNSLQDALPPSELSQNNYTLVYNILEKTQRGNLDITDWLEWFLNCLLSAIQNSEKVLSDIFQKHKRCNKFH